MVGLRDNSEGVGYTRGRFVPGSIRKRWRVESASDEIASIH